MVEGSLRLILHALGIEVLSRGTNGWLRARCPFAPWTHEHGTDRRPGFGALICDDGASHFKCLACGKKGEISSLVRQLEHYRDRKYPGLAIQADVADAEGIMSISWDDQMLLRLERAEDGIHTVDEEAIDGAYEHAWDRKPSRDYLSKRGISEEATKLLGLMYDPDEYRVMFPVRDRQGALYGFTGRSVLGEEHYTSKYPKVRDYLGLPKRALLLGEHLWQPGLPAFCVEGLIGFASLITQGVRDICNPLCLLGAEMTPQKAERLDMLRASVYLMLDDDMGGEIGLWGTFDQATRQHSGDGAVSRLMSRGMNIYVPSWPPGKSDPDELLRTEVQSIINTTMPYVE